MNAPESKLTNLQVKKLYAKPEIVYQEPLEVMAAVCGGTPAKSDNTGMNPCGTPFGS